MLEAIKPILETICAKFIFIIFLHYLLALCGVDQTYIIVHMEQVKAKATQV